ncbi:MAG: DMT family transporter [Pseudomonadota bacterium]
MMGAGRAPLGVHLGLMATMAIWALNVSAVKWLTGALDVMLVAALRMACASLVLVLLLCLGRQAFPRWRGRMLAMACACALLMVYANQAIFALAMEKTTATNAALILALNPLLNGALEALFFRKRMPARYWSGGLLAVAGVVMVILNGPAIHLGGPSAGDLLVLASMLSFSLGVLLMQRLSRDNAPLAINVFLYLAGTLALALHAGLLVDAPFGALLRLDWRIWAVVVFSGAIASALGAIAWARGVAALGLGKAAIYMSWVPVLGVGFGALLLGEKLTQWHFFGMILVLAGTVTSSLPFERQVASASAAPAVK